MVPAVPADRALIPRLRKEGVFVHLDVDKAPDLARVLQISCLPTVIVWRKAEERWVVTRATGAPAIKKLLEPTPPVKTNGDASVSGAAEAASGSGLAGAAVEIETRRTRVQPLFSERHIQRSPLRHYSNSVGRDRRNSVAALGT